MHYRRFYERKYGGSAQALQAAIAWRDQQLTKAKVLTVVEFCRQERSNNTSGVPGVHFLAPAAQPQGIWQAMLRLDGSRRISKTFSVQKYGYQRAFEQAVAARDDMLAHAEDRPYLKDSLAKRIAVKARTPSKRVRSIHSENPAGSPDVLLHI